MDSGSGLGGVPDSQCQGPACYCRMRGSLGEMGQAELAMMRWVTSCQS